MNGDQLIIHEPRRAISYKGPEVFIAGSNCITQFIAILRHFEADRKLVGEPLSIQNITARDLIRND
jgi:hypothetical protein